ncbi:hypothetical protein ACFQNJ_01350 [Hydrogenophaga bisanensis]|uniref:Uncharacterized protein n=1 Tax=Hydrogenophaga bisanensis TaxID=439611 RepID=A0ABW2R5J0_9BURK
MTAEAHLDQVGFCTWSGIFFSQRTPAEINQTVNGMRHKSAHA